MFGIGALEIVVIVAFALIFIGPDRLPEFARQFGRFFVKVRRMSNEARRTIDEALKEAEYDLLVEERKKVQALLDEHQKRAEQAAKDLMEDTGSEPTKNE